MPEATDVVVPETRANDPVESPKVCKCKTKGKPALADSTAPEPPVLDPSTDKEKVKGEDLSWLTSPQRFFADSKYFLMKCTKPDGHGIRCSCTLTAELRMTFGAIWQGFLIMGCLAFVIRLAHIPLNQILVIEYHA
jgi:preprotein translocase subunit Sss1